MIINYNINKLKSILDDFCYITGISMAVADTDGVFFYSTDNKNSGYCLAIHKSCEGTERCLCSDETLIKECREKQGAVSHICHAGLVDSAVPIFKNGIITGYIIIGRIRQKHIDLKEISNTYNLLPSKCEKLYNNLPYYSPEQITSICNLVSHMLIENTIDLTYNPIIDNAVKYIKENYTSEITIKSLCDALHVSKNTLYENFHNAFGNTVNAYISEYRINKAKKLLTNTDEPLYIISEKIGIRNNAYFCRLFKKTTGFTPSEFRKRNS